MAVSLLSSPRALGERLACKTLPRYLLCPPAHSAAHTPHPSCQQSLQLGGMSCLFSTRGLGAAFWKLCQPNCSLRHCNGRAVHSPWGYHRAAIAKKQLGNELSASLPLKSTSSLPILGMGTLDVFALFQMCLQVHFQERWAAGVIGATNWPVITAAFMISAHGEKQKEGKISDKQKINGNHTDHQERS